MNQFRGLSIALLCVLGPIAPTHARILTLSLTVTVDQVAEEDATQYKPGAVDHLRITYDTRSIVRSSHRGPIQSLSHFIGNRWMNIEPADASILDLSSQPYALNFVAAAVHGRPIVVVFEAQTRRMAILARPDFHVLIAGQYSIDPKPLTPSQIAAPPARAAMTSP
jgi:hypothetical protein